MEVIEEKTFKPILIKLYDSVDVEIMRAILKIADTHISKTHHSTDYFGIDRVTMKEHVNYLCSKI